MNRGTILRGAGFGFAPEFFQPSSGLPMSVPEEASVETAYGWLVAVVSTLMITVAFGSTYLVVVGLKPIAAEGKDCP